MEFLLKFFWKNFIKLKKFNLMIAEKFLLWDHVFGRLSIWNVMRIIFAFC